MYASFLTISGALYLDLFEPPVKNKVFRILLGVKFFTALITINRIGKVFGPALGAKG
jgi:hypothetical protein